MNTVTTRNTLAMTPSEWIPLLSSAGFGVLVKWCSEEWKKLREKRQASKQFFKDIAVLYEVLTPGINLTRMDRWTLFQIHNGGKRLNLTSESFLTIMYEGYKDILEARREKYQGYRLDKSFYEMLDKAYTQGFASTSEAAEGRGRYKDMLATSGIVHNEIFFLCEDRTGLYFLSYSSTEVEEGEIDALGKSTMSECANRAAMLLSKRMKK